MSVCEMTYYRVTCDHGDCETYTNVAATDKAHLSQILEKMKWAKLSVLNSLAYCPEHRMVNP